MNKQDTENLLNVIQKETGVSEIEMASKSRLREVVWSRYLFNYFAKDYLFWTELQVTLFLNKNRTMLYHFKLKHDDFLGRDHEYTLMFQNIRQALNRMEKVEKFEALLSYAEMVNAKMVNKRILIGIDVPELECA